MKNPSFSPCRPWAWAGVTALALLSACAGYAPGDWPPGTPRSEVVQAIGQPTAERGPASDSPPGTVQRLEYARGPMGRHTFMLDFDAQQRLLAITQVLTPTHFDRVRPGMTQQELLDLLGRPSDVRRLPRQHQKVWSYRYANAFCLWYEVSLSEDSAKVVETGEGSDPACEKRLD